MSRKFSIHCQLSTIGGWTFGTNSKREISIAQARSLVNLLIPFGERRDICICKIRNRIKPVNSFR